MYQVYRAFLPKKDKEAAGMIDPASLQWPGDYRSACEVEATDPESAFGQLQHHSEGCPMPAELPSFSVGGVLVDESGQALRCLSVGWERM